MLGSCHSHCSEAIECLGGQERARAKVMMRPSSAKGGDLVEFAVAAAAVGVFVAADVAEVIALPRQDGGRWLGPASSRPASREGQAGMAIWRHPGYRASALLHPDPCQRDQVRPGAGPT